MIHGTLTVPVPKDLSENAICVIKQIAIANDYTTKSIDNLLKEDQY